MLVTCTEPLIPADDATDTVVDAVRPGPEIFKLTAFGENVRVCALAVSGLHITAKAAKATNPVRQLCLRKRFLQESIRDHLIRTAGALRCGCSIATKGPCYRQSELPRLISSCHSSSLTFMQRWGYTNFRRRRLKLSSRERGKIKTA